MIIKKEYTLDEVYSEFTHLEAINTLYLLYEAKLNLLQTLNSISDKDYDAHAFMAERDLDLVDKNIEVFKIGIMVHETKIFHKVNIKGQITLIGNN